MDIALGILIHHGRVLVAQRPKQQHLGGFWEFPGGKVEPQESPASAVVREVHEECGLSSQVIEAWPVFSWQYPDCSLTFYPFILKLLAGKAEAKLGQELKWVTQVGLKSLTFPDANQHLLSRIEADFNLICDRIDVC